MCGITGMHMEEWAMENEKYNARYYFYRAEQYRRCYSAVLDIDHELAEQIWKAADLLESRARALGFKEEQEAQDRDHKEELRDNRP